MTILPKWFQLFSIILLSLREISTFSNKWFQTCRLQTCWMLERIKLLYPSLSAWCGSVVVFLIHFKVLYQKMAFWKIISWTKKNTQKNWNCRRQCSQFFPRLTFNQVMRNISVSFIQRKYITNLLVMLKLQNTAFVTSDWLKFKLFVFNSIPVTTSQWPVHLTMFPIFFQQNLNYPLATI